MNNRIRFACIIMASCAVVQVTGTKALAQDQYNCIEQLRDGVPGTTVEAANDKRFCDAVFAALGDLTGARQSLFNVKQAAWSMHFDENTPSRITAKSDWVSGFRWAYQRAGYARHSVPSALAQVMFSCDTA